MSLITISFLTSHRQRNSLSDGRTNLHNTLKSKTAFKSSYSDILLLTSMESTTPTEKVVITYASTQLKIHEKNIYNSMNLDFGAVGQVAPDSTTKVDNETSDGSNDEITNPYECTINLL
ncbi:hypothetical protein Tco_1556878 [Tanacetum coccineum]